MAGQRLMKARLLVDCLVIARRSSLLYPFYPANNHITVICDNLPIVTFILQRMC